MYLNAEMWPGQENVEGQVILGEKVGQDGGQRSQPPKGTYTPTRGVVCAI
jgi:hypothetical protein